MKKPSTHSASPVGSSDPKSAITVATGISFRPLLRVLGQTRPRSFRVFWGAMLDDNPRLRKVRDKSAIVLPRSEFKRILEEAFNAGAASK